MRDAILWMCMMQKQAEKAGVVIHWRFESQFWNGEVERTLREVQQETGVNLRIVKVPTPRGKKIDRMLTMVAWYQNGRIYYNQELKPHADTQTGLKQLYGLEPSYKGHDDAPDADEQAITECDKYISVGSGSGNYVAGKMDPKHERL